MDEFISKIIKNFDSSFKIIESESLKIIDKIADINLDILDKEPLKSLYSKESQSAISLIIFSIIFGVVLYKIVKQFISLYNTEYLNNLYFFVIKIIIVVLIATNTRYIVEEIININHLFTKVTESFLSEIADEEISYKSLVKQVTTLDDFFKDRYKLDIKDSTKGISCIIIVSLLIIFSIRYVIILLIIILFPFFVILLLFDRGKVIFLNLFEFFISNLLIQILNKVIIFIPIISKKEEMFEMILIGSLFVLYKLNKSIINIGDIWKR